MANERVLPPTTIISAGDMSQATLTSTTVDITYLDNIGIQGVFTGSPTGTFAVNASLNQTTWTPLTLSPSPAATGSAGNFLVDLNELPYPYLQVVYTKTSGTGSLTVQVSGKLV